MPTPAFFDSPDPRIHFDNPNLFWDVGLVEEPGMAESIQIKLETTRLSDQELIELGTLVSTNMALPANAPLVTNSPHTSAQVEGQVDDFSAKRNAQVAAKAAAKTTTTAKNTSEA